MMQSLQKDTLDHTMNKHQSHFSASSSSEVVSDQERAATKRTDARTLVWISQEKLQDLINFAHIQYESMAEPPIKAILPRDDSSTGGGGGESGLLRAKSSLAIISSKLDDILGGAAALTESTTCSGQHDTVSLKRKSSSSQEKGGCEIISSSSLSTSKKKKTSKAPGDEKLLANEEEEESFKTAVSKGTPMGPILHPTTKAGQSSRELQELQGTRTVEPLNSTGTPALSSKKLPAKTVHKSSNITSRTKAILKDKSNNASMNGSTTKESKNKVVSKRAGGTKSLTPAQKQLRKWKKTLEASCKSGTKNDKARPKIATAGQKRPPGTISSTSAQLPPKRHNHTVVNANGRASISQHPPDGREKVVPTSASWHPFEDSIIVHCWKSCLDHSLSTPVSWISMVQERLAGRSAYEIQHRFTHFHQKRLVAEQDILMNAAVHPTNIHPAATGSIGILPHRRTLTGKRTSSDMDAAATNAAANMARNSQRQIASESSRTMHATAPTAVQQRSLTTSGSHKGAAITIRQHQLGSDGNHKDTTAACCPIQPRPSAKKNSQRNPSATATAAIVPQPPPELTSTNSRMLVGAAAAAAATTQQYQLASNRSHRGDPTIAPTIVKQRHLATNNSHMGASTAVHNGHGQFLAGSSSHMQPHSKIAQQSPWTAPDDARLLYCQKVYCGSGDIEGSWRDIALQFPGRSGLECQLRYRLLSQVDPRR